MQDVLIAILVAFLACQLIVMDGKKEKASEKTSSVTSGRSLLAISYLIGL